MKLFKNWSTLNAGQHLKMLQRRPPEASVLSNILFTPSPTLYTPFHNRKDGPTSFYIGLAHCTAMKCNILPRPICCQRSPYMWKYVYTLCNLCTGWVQFLEHPCALVSFHQYLLVSSGLSDLYIAFSQSQAW